MKENTRLRVRVNPPKMLIYQCTSLVCVNAILQKEDNLEITLRILSRMVNDLLMRPYGSERSSEYYVMVHSVFSSGQCILAKFPIPSYVRICKKGASGNERDLGFVYV